MAKTKKMSAFRAKAVAVLARAGRSKRPRAASVFQKSFSGTEAKYVDVTIQNRYDTTGNPTLLNGVGQGSDNTNRIGRQFKMISLGSKGYIVGGVANQTGSVPCRTLIVYDKESQGASPVIGDVLVNGDVAGQLNLNNKDRFIVLMDVIHETNYPLGFDGAGSYSIKINTWRKIRLPVINGGTGATIAGINTGAVFVFNIGRFAPSANNPVSQITYRIKFTDQ